jgi:hypothetical protein
VRSSHPRRHQALRRSVTALLQFIALSSYVLTVTRGLF